MVCVLKSAHACSKKNESSQGNTVLYLGMLLVSSLGGWI